jgi:hypothetical protein
MICLGPDPDMGRSCAYRKEGKESLSQVGEFIL